MDALYISRQPIALNPLPSDEGDAFSWSFDPEGHTVYYPASLDRANCLLEEGMISADSTKLVGLDTESDGNRNLCVIQVSFESLTVVMSVHRLGGEFLSSIMLERQDLIRFQAYRRSCFRF